LEVIMISTVPILCTIRHPAYIHILIISIWRTATARKTRWNIWIL